MKKIIDGRTYNTETATLLCSYEYSYVSSFDWYTEALYRTRKGAYFIYGEGHANSPYATQYDLHEWGPGDGWRVLTEEEAREYIEEKGSTAEYIEAFGEPEEA